MRVPSPAPSQWRFEHGDVRVLFLGRCPPRADRGDALARAVVAAPPVATARQVHGAHVLEGREGACGEGDAIVTSRAGLALSVVTADCVPVLMTAGRRIAAIHAGWRGLAADVIGAAAARVVGVEADGEALAWIGPAIGACCYEVDEEVARSVAAVCGDQVVVHGRAKPHLDLQRAARRQLERLGVGVSTTVEQCTHCNPESLWSYRRDGAGAGRNIAYVWRTG